MKLGTVFNSLVLRLLALGLAAAVLGTVTSYFRITGFLREDLAQTVAAQQLSLAQYAARDVDASITERGAYLTRLAGSMPRDLLGRPGLLREWLRERQQLQPLFSLGLLVADAGGRVLTAFPDLPGAPGSQPDHVPATPAQWARVLAQDLVIARPQRGPILGRPILPMSARIVDAAGLPIGVLIGIAEISEDGFLQRLLQARSGVGGGLLLISPQDKLFVAATDPALALRPTPPQGVNLLHDRAMEGFRGSGLTINAQGVEEVSAIASVPSTGWFLVARLPTSEAFATVSRVQAFIVSQRLIGVFLMLGIITLVAIMMLRPLYRAADQADRMTRGETPLAPLPVGRDDEVGHLTTAFNRLIAKLSENQAELERLAHHDALTGLPNRKLLSDRMQQALAGARRQARSVALLYLDLDGFKAINDTLGHDAGDRALKEVALRLAQVVRGSDTLARIGGDEFVLLAGDLAEPARAGASALAVKCIDALRQPLNLSDGEHVIGVSIGIALSDGSGNADQLLAAADKAMYVAKQRASGGFEFAA